MNLKGTWNLLAITTASLALVSSLHAVAYAAISARYDFVPTNNKNAPCPDGMVWRDSPVNGCYAYDLIKCASGYVNIKGYCWDAPTSKAPASEGPGTSAQSETAPAGSPEPTAASPAAPAATPAPGPALGADTQATLRNLSLLSPSCVTLFGLDNGTAIWNNQYLTSGLCEADKSLIAKYPFNTCNASIFGSNSARPPGIIKLNPTFAVNIAAFLDMPEISHLKIIYGYVDPSNKLVTPTGSCAPYGSIYTSHTRGCAVSLNLKRDTCDTPECKFIQANARAFGLYPPVPGAYNVIQPADDAACNSAAAAVSAGTQAGGSAANPSGAGGATQSPLSGQRYIGLQSSPSYSALAGPNNNSAGISSGSSGLFGGPMGMMFGLMMGMQVGQVLGTALNRPASASANPAPTPLPPAPPAPVSPTSAAPVASGSASNIDALIGALNNAPATTTCAADVQVCADGSTVGRVAPSCSFAACPVGTSTPGQVAPVSPPADTSAATNTSEIVGGPATVAISSSTEINDLQPAIDALESASSALSSGAAQSTSTLQNVLNNFLDALSSIGSFIGHAFGAGAATP